MVVSHVYAGDTDQARYGPTAPVELDAGERLPGVLVHYAFDDVVPLPQYSQPSAIQEAVPDIRLAGVPGVERPGDGNGSPRREATQGPRSFPIPVHDPHSIQRWRTGW